MNVATKYTDAHTIWYKNCGCFGCSGRVHSNMHRDDPDEHEIGYSEKEKQAFRVEGHPIFTIINPLPLELGLLPCVLPAGLLSDSEHPRHVTASEG